MTPKCVNVEGDEPCNGYQIIRTHLEVEREVQKTPIIERDKWFNMAMRLKKASEEACDLLAERTHGSPARSAGHNARLRLEAALN